VKKILALILAAALAMAALAGCTKPADNSGNDTTAATTAADTKTDDTTAAPADGSIPKIVMECLYFDAVPRDLEAVEAAMNEISIPEIGVEVELYPLGFSEASQQVGLMISGGQQLDLIV